MTDAEQQRRLAQLRSRTAEAATATHTAQSPTVSKGRRSRGHPALVARIAVTGLSTASMFALVAKLGVDAGAEQVTAAEDVAQPAPTTTSVPAGPTQAELEAFAEAKLEAEMAEATLVTAPPIRVTVPPVTRPPVRSSGTAGGGSSSSSSRSSGATGATAASSGSSRSSSGGAVAQVPRAAPVARATPAPAAAPTPAPAPAPVATAAPAPAPVRTSGSG